MKLLPGRRSLSPLNDEFMTDIERQMSRFVDEHFGGLSSGFVPPMDIVEDKESITCTLEIPGMKKEDIEILIEDNLLTIRGTRNFVREEGEDKRWHLVERRYGKFERSVRLTHMVDSAKVAAEFKDGLLNVRLPKAEQAKPRRIEIN